MVRSYIQKESFLGFFWKTTIIVNALFLLKCLEAAPAESICKGTKKLAKNKKKWDLFSFLLQISKIKRSSLAIHKFNFTIELAF
ncbi:hypothetical protein PREVCOP_03883 [Segatella copri DSM 18205]|uniref:Uncharacterized protein n=1 Tax=Segatella copri DSM 18205 TaxID=537011 RepID=D1P9K0_9BACT|nr:hypothetical protein PREVCOP_03883 [Segatella copri DSM 18205]